MNVNEGVWLVSLSLFVIGLRQMCSVTEHAHGGIAKLYAIARTRSGLWRTASFGLLVCSSGREGRSVSATEAPRTTSRRAVCFWFYMGGIPPIPPEMRRRDPLKPFWASHWQYRASVKRLIVDPLQEPSAPHLPPPRTYPDSHAPR